MTKYKLIVKKFFKSIFFSLKSVSKRYKKKNLSNKIDFKKFSKPIILRLIKEEIIIIKKKKKERGVNFCLILI